MNQPTLADVKLTNMRQHLLTLLFAVAFVLPVAAVEAEIGGLWYDLDQSKHTATVINPDSLRQQGLPAYKDVMSLTLPEAVKHNNRKYKVVAIGDSAFAGCKRLAAIALPERLTAIGANAFRNCTSIRVIEIPESVKHIGDEAFAGCKSLTAILFLSKTPPAMGADVFLDAATHGNYQYINVPCGTEDTYKSQWPTYKGAIRERCM